MGKDSKKSDNNSDKENGFIGTTFGVLTALFGGIGLLFLPLDFAERVRCFIGICPEDPFVRVSWDYSIGIGNGALYMDTCTPDSRIILGRAGQCIDRFQLQARLARPSDSLNIKNGVIYGKNYVVQITADNTPERPGRWIAVKQIKIEKVENDLVFNVSDFKLLNRDNEGR